MIEVPMMQRIRHWRDEATQTLPLATIIGFIAFVWYVTPVFHDWGLSPIQLMAPADAILPGLGVGAGLIAVLQTAAMIGWVIYGAMSRLSQTNKLWALAALGLVCAAPLLPGLTGWGWRFAAALVSLGCAHCAFQHREIFKSVPVHHFPLALLAIVPAVLWSSFLVCETQKSLMANGFSGNLFIEELHDAPCSGHVLWRGHEAIVIRCTAPYRAIKVMTAKDGLVLRAATSDELKLERSMTSPPSPAAPSTTKAQ